MKEFDYMKAYLRPFLFVLLFGAVSCASIPTKSSQTLTLTLENDDVRFEIGEKFRIIQSPDNVNNAYVLQSRYSSQYPTISISFLPLDVYTQVRCDSAEDLHQLRLKLARKEFPSASMNLVQSIYLDGVPTPLYKYDGNDGSQLVVFVMQDRSVFELRMNSDLPQLLDYHKDDFLEVAESVRFAP